MLIGIAEVVNEGISLLNLRFPCHCIIMKLLYALIGLIALLAGLLMLDLSEDRATQDIAMIGYVASHVVDVNSDTLDPSKDNMIVHLSGLLKSDSPVVDPDTGITVQSLSLHRYVQMFQWQHQTTFHTTHHNSLWSAVRIPQGPSVADPKAPSNPSMPFQSQTFNAPAPHVGAYLLDDSLVSAAARFKPTPLAAGYPQPGSNLLYQGYDPQNPTVGDVRAWYSDSPYQTVSVIALQSNGKLVPIHFAATGEDLVLVHHGDADASTHIGNIMHGIMARRWNGRVETFIAATIAIAFMLLTFKDDTKPLMVALAAPPCALAMECIVLQLYATISEPGFGAVFFSGGLATLILVFLAHEIIKVATSRDAR